MPICAEVQGILNRVKNDRPNLSTWTNFYQEQGNLMCHTPAHVCSTSLWLEKPSHLLQPWDYALSTSLSVTGLFLAPQPSDKQPLLLICQSSQSHQTLQSLPLLLWPWVIFTRFPMQLLAPVNVCTIHSWSIVMQLNLSCVIIDWVQQTFVDILYLYPLHRFKVQKKC